MASLSPSSGTTTSTVVRSCPLNKRLEALCDEKEVTYLDVWGALADHEGRLDKRYTNDGLHLTGEGYVVWRDAIKQHVK